MLTATETTTQEATSPVASPQASAIEINALVVNYGDKRFTVRGIKRAIDGALGSRGAWM